MMRSYLQADTTDVEIPRFPPSSRSDQVEQLK
jgi:hypothetical protein